MQDPPEGHAARGQSVPHAEKPVIADRGGFRPGDEDGAPHSALVEMCDQPVHGRRMIAGHRRGDETERGAVIEHDRHALAFGSLQRRKRQQRAGDYAVDVEGEQVRRPGCGLRVLRHGAEKHAVAGGLDRIAEGAQHVGVIARGQFRHHHTDHARALGDERTGDLAGKISERPRGCLDLGARLAGNRAAVAEGARNRGLRDAGEPRDIIGGRPREGPVHRVRGQFF